MDELPTPDGPVADIDLVMMELLRAHVPLSLLIDLTYPEGPRSSEILADEAG